MNPEQFMPAKNVTLLPRVGELTYLLHQTERGWEIISAKVSLSSDTETLRSILNEALENLDQPN